jgi:hypothetical protein
MVAEDEQGGFKIEARAALAAVTYFEVEVWANLCLKGAKRLETLLPLLEQSIVLGRLFAVYVATDCARPTSVLIIHKITKTLTGASSKVQ